VPGQQLLPSNRRSISGLESQKQTCTRRISELRRRRHNKRSNSRSFAGIRGTTTAVAVSLMRVSTPGTLNATDPLAIRPARVSAAPPRNQAPAVVATDIGGRDFEKGFQLKSRAQRRAVNHLDRVTSGPNATDQSQQSRARGGRVSARVAIKLPSDRRHNRESNSRKVSWIKSQQRPSQYHLGCVYVPAPMLHPQHSRPPEK